MKGTLTRQLQVQLGQVLVAPFQLHHQSSSTSSSLSNPSFFQSILEQEPAESNLPSSSGADADADADANEDEKDFILSQDFFWYSNFFLTNETKKS